MHIIRMKSYLTDFSRHISCLASDSLINMVNPKLDIIVPKLDSLVGMLHNLNTSKISATNEMLPEEFKNPDILDHTKELKRTAKAVISTASSVGANSSWGGSETRQQFSSENGVPLDENRKSRIEQWIPQPTIDEVLDQERDVSPSTGETSQSAVERSDDESKSLDSESDGEIEVDVVNGFFSQGQRNAAGGKHLVAIDCFRAGLERAAKLSVKRKSSLDLKDVHLRLAFSYLHEGQLSAAERLFNKLIRDTSDDKGVTRALLASSGLAQIRLCQNSFSDAEFWCRKSLNGWKRLVGKHHPLYINSLWLFEFFHETKGDAATAGVFADLIRVAKTGTEAEGLADQKVLGFPPEEIRALITNIRRKSAETLLLSLGFDPNVPGLFAKGSTVADVALLKLANTKAGEDLRCSSNLTLAAQYLLDKGAHADVKNTNGVTALLYASIHGHQGIVQLLCELGADVKQENHLGDTPLHAAARNGHLLVVKLLCEHGAEPKAKKIAAVKSEAGWKKDSVKLENVSTPGDTAVLEAARGGYATIVEFLLSKGADLEDNDNPSHQTALLAAVGKGHESTARFLLAAGANPDAETSTGAAALHIAVKNGSEALVKVLLDNGASLEKRTKIGFTPLMVAAARDDARAIELLLNAGADIEAKDNLKYTALHLATSKSAGAAMKALLSRGASNETPPYVTTPLHKAAMDDLTLAAKILLEAGVDPEVKNEEHNTALIIASQKGNRRMTRLLVDHGASIEAKGRHSHTAFFVAAFMGNLEIVKILLDAGATPEAKNSRRETAVIAIVNNKGDGLPVPSGRRRVEMLELLCERGANPAAKDSNGKTALYWAGKDGTGYKKALVQILKNHGAKK